MILVTGATGNVGSEAVRLASARGERVRAFARDLSRVPASSGVETIEGDFTRPASLDAAMAGVDVVILVSPAVPDQEIAAIDAAVRAGVAHVVKATSKASADSPVERRRGQTRIEEHLAASGLPHTLLRSNAYMQNLFAMAPMIKATDGFVMSAGDGRVGMVDARDVAAVAVAVALDPAAHAGATYWPTGPSLVSYVDVAVALSQLLGREIDYRRITGEQHYDAMVAAGVPAPVAASNRQAFELIAGGDAAWVSGDVEAVTGTAPRTLTTFLDDYRAAFV